MASDKYSAVWVSHSSIGDFLKCPRAYYLHNVYKDPKTKKKINIVNPALSLGQAVHTTLENLKNFPVTERFSRDLFADFEQAWSAVSGKKGGFTSVEEEEEVKKRGRAMIERVIAHPGILAEKTVRLKESAYGMPPNIYLSKEHNIILCGLVDWLVYDEKTDGIYILDFKTGKHDESDDSLQLPIYLILLSELQKRPIVGAYYWYIDRDDTPTEKMLPILEDARACVLAQAIEIKIAREKKEFFCPRGEEGCFTCRPFEKILRGEAEFVGGNDRQDNYIV